MHLLITYDVAIANANGPQRLRRVSRACSDYGQRVQYSVFECLVTPAEYVALKSRLLEIIDLDTDSLRFYNLGSEWNGRVEHFGTKPSWDPEGPLVI